MKYSLDKLASLRLTLVGMIGVVVVALVASRSAAISTDLTAIPIALLAINLFAAICVNNTFRHQIGLLVFHVCLLFVVLLIGLSMLLRFDGRVELVEGESFAAAAVTETARGAWHPERLTEIEFSQGIVEVDYLPGGVRQATHSVLAVPGSTSVLTVGDREAAVFDGYRFLATFNKGFALVVDWASPDGEVQRGAINFPSYPEFEWKQVNTWTTPAGQVLEFELLLALQPARDEAWVLRASKRDFTLKISTTGDTVRTLGSGEVLRLRDGTLRIEGLRMWMGYRISFDPLLPWIFATAMLALLALAFHFQEKYWPQRERGRVRAGERNVHLSSN